MKPTPMRSVAVEFNMRGWVVETLERDTPDRNMHFQMVVLPALPWKEQLMLRRVVIACDYN